jgi:predicted metal-dependent phosphoesterase TrpH
MKIDFHTHGKLSKKLPVSIQYMEAMFNGARIAGLDAICLTEHFNTIGFYELYNHIRTHYQQEGDTFMYQGLRIFPGMEVDVREGVHILVLGKIDDIMTMNQELENHKQKESFVSFTELVKRTKRKGLFIGAAHPYREGSEALKIDAKLLDAFDFLDMNGKDVAYGQKAAMDLVKNLSERLQKPVTAGSDTHQPNQYGCIFNEFADGINSFDALFEAIQKGEYEIRVSEDIYDRVDRAVAMKIKLKALHEEGLDYVAYLGTCLA